MLIDKNCEGLIFQAFSKRELENKWDQLIDNFADTLLLTFKKNISNFLINKKAGNFAFVYNNNYYNVSVYMGMTGYSHMLILSKIILHLKDGELKFNNMDNFVSFLYKN